MPTVKFNATKGRDAYNGVALFYDGDEKEVTQDQAAYLLKTWPENFTIVNPVQERSLKGGKTKMVKRTEDK